MRVSSLLAVLAVPIALLGCNDGGCGYGQTCGRAAIGEPIDVPGQTRIDLPGRVSMLVRVLDRLGNPHPGLVAEDFRLFENDVEISPSEAQQRLPRVHQLLSLLLLDLHSSISQDPAARLDDRLREQPDDRARRLGGRVRPVGALLREA